MICRQPGRRYLKGSAPAAAPAQLAEVGATNQNVLRDQPASIIFNFFIFNCFCQPERRREWQEVQLSRLREGVEAVIERERV